VRSLLALGFLALLLAPGASACQAVYPLIDLEFPQKVRCSPVAPEECDPAPRNATDDYVQEGTFHWRWDLDNCGASSFGPSMDPVVVTFAPYARNPSWLEATMEPAEITITFEDQWDLMDDQNDPASGSFTFREDYPVKITIHRTGDPTPDELARLDDRNGVVDLLLKALTSETPMFQAAITVEPFSFNAAPLLEPEPAHGKESPAVPVPALALAFLACAVAARRR
jgi:hypothetical protein